MLRLLFVFELFLITWSRISPCPSIGSAAYYSWMSFRQIFSFVVYCQ